MNQYKKQKTPKCCQLSISFGPPIKHGCVSLKIKSKRPSSVLRGTPTVPQVTQSEGTSESQEITQGAAQLSVQNNSVFVTKRWVELFEMERTFWDICLEWKNMKTWHFPLNSYHCTIMPCASLASLWRVNRLTLRATDPGVAPWCNWHCATWCMHQLHQNTSIV